MTRRKRKYKRNFTLVILILFALAIFSLLSTDQLRISFANDIADSSNTTDSLKNLTYFNSSENLSFDKSSLTQEKTVLLFSSSWCGSCEMLRREIKDTAEKNPEIKFVELEIDGFRDLANELDVKTAPAVVFFQNDEFKTISSIDLATLSANLDFFISDLFENVGKI
jgi:thiol-disulfide isomerase/thioredoxin